MSKFGSNIGVICINKETAYEVEKWRLSQGYQPTPTDYIDKDFSISDARALAITHDWGIIPVTTSTKKVITYQEFKDILSGKINFKTITDSLASLLEYKNKKYGNSALEPLLVFSGKTKLGTRMDDKLARIKNSSELKKNDVADCIGYLMLICAENGWDNFDEFKD